MAYDAPTPNGFPPESWWLDRDQFYVNAQYQLERMRRSYFGRREQITHGPSIDRHLKKETPHVRELVDRPRADPR